MVRTKQTARKSTNPKLLVQETTKKLLFARKSTTTTLVTQFLALQTARKSTTKASLKAKQKPKQSKTVGQVKPPDYRHRPGAKALKEIRHYQSTTALLVPRLPFQRLVREICQGLKSDYRFHVVALEALQVFL